MKALLPIWRIHDRAESLLLPVCRRNGRRSIRICLFQLVGSVGKKRLPVLRLVLRQKATETEPELQARLIAETTRTLAKDKILLAILKSSADLTMRLLPPTL